MTDRKKPTLKDIEKCEQEAIDAALDLMPGDWGQIVTSSKGLKGPSTTAVASFPHNKHGGFGFAIISDIHHGGYANRRYDQDEDYWTGFQLNHNQIEWLYKALGQHLKNRELCQQGFDYKKGDKIRLKEGATLENFKNGINPAGAVGCADYIDDDHNSAVVRVSWDEGEIKDFWRFAPAGLFEKASLPKVPKHEPSLAKKDEFINLLVSGKLWEINRRWPKVFEETKFKEFEDWLDTQNGEIGLSFQFWCKDEGVYKVTFVAEYKDDPLGFSKMLFDVSLDKIPEFCFGKVDTCVIGKNND